MRKTKLWKNKTEEEYLKRLLEYPPTEGTWYHDSVIEKVKVIDDEDVVTKVNVRHVNSAKAKVCTSCGKKRPAKPKRLWPDYVRACKIVGIDPGMIWKQKEDGTAIMRVPGGSWKTEH